MFAIGKGARVAVLAALAMTLSLVVPVAHANESSPRLPRVATLTARVAGSVVKHLPFGASNVAVYWPGQPDATVTIAFSHDGRHFSQPVDVGRDELGEQRHNGMTYGALLPANGATAIRVTSDKVIARLRVLGLLDRVKAIVRRLTPAVVPPVVGPKQPPVISRSEWGADESLRFEANGAESWPPTFAPVQKLIVHHTATTINDPNPAATVRAIYYFHAITQGWGDIGYNFLIDEAGRIYKGRNSHAPGQSADTITGQNAKGDGVTGAHAQHFNAGSVGVAFLGTFTNASPTPAAKQALEALLAWEAKTHHIDPNGASTYTNPETGTQKVFPNIAGHRDVNPTTECPGDVFYGELPAIRSGVAARAA